MNFGVLRSCAYLDPAVSSRESNPITPIGWSIDRTGGPFAAPQPPADCLSSTALPALPALPMPDLFSVIIMDHTVRANGRTLPFPGLSPTAHHIATYLSHDHTVADTGRPSLAMSIAGDHRQSLWLRSDASSKFPLLGSRFTKQGSFWYPQSDCRIRNPTANDSSGHWVRGAIRVNGDGEQLAPEASLFLDLASFDVKDEVLVDNEPLPKHIFCSFCGVEPDP